MHTRKLSRALLIATICAAVMATSFVEIPAASATDDPVGSSTTGSSPTSTTAPTTDTPLPTDQPTSSAPATSAPFVGLADPDVSPDSSPEELQAQADAQERLQADSSARKGLSPFSASSLAASAFDPGYIVSDATFYNGNAAGADWVQTFLNSMVSSCRSGYVCLKDYRVPTSYRDANPMCSAYSGAPSESAATIIYKVGVACGISQKALLVLLQKEQSLVTDDWPSARQYAAATGYACPDTADCDTNYAGFYNQVYWAAYQFKRYGNPPGTSQFFTWYPVGGTVNIRFHPNVDCGSAPVSIRNKATAALYYYTPYQPNAAALAGNGDSCSAYGNLNFWGIFSRWFGSPTDPPVPPAPPHLSLEYVTTANGLFAVTGWTADPTDFSASNQVRIDITMASRPTFSVTLDANINRPDLAAVLPSFGPNHGYFWASNISESGSYTACVTALALPGNTGGNTSAGCRTVFYSATTGSTPSTSRIQAADRYAGAVAISQAAFPGSAGARVVYVVTGTKYPDALSAAPAAAKEGGPLLLTLPDQLLPNVAAEITRLQPSKIVVVGGTDSVSDGVFAQIRALRPGATTTRIAGADRYETSRSIATTVFGSQVSSLYVATGNDFPDALSAGAAAGSKSQPVLLVDGSAAALDAKTKALLTSLRVSSISVVGGPNTFSPAVLNGLSAVAQTTRLFGADRADTSAAVNAAAFTQSGQVYFATGLNFPDALAGSVIAAKQKSPLYVLPSTCVPASILDEIVRLKATRAILLGGPDVLAGAVERLAPC